MRALIVKNSSTALVVEERLNVQWFCCTSVQGVNQAAELVRLYDYDVIVYCSEIPEAAVHAVTALSAQRKAPVFVIVNRTSEEGEIQLLSAGASCCKTFRDFNLALAHLRGVVRRHYGHAQAVLTVGKLSLDTDTHTFKAGEVYINVGRREYQVAEFLFLNRNRAVSRDRILNALYNNEPDEFVQDRTVDSWIRRIRHRLRRAGFWEEYICTIHGLGYMLCNPGEVNHPPMRKQNRNFRTPAHRAQS
jgi:two-component system cell cycle response regulator CtrA